MSKQIVEKRIEDVSQPVDTDSGKSSAPESVASFPENPAQKDTRYGAEAAIRKNFIELLLILVKYRMLIVFMVIFFGFIGFQLSVGMKNVYRSSATLIPRKSDQGLSSYGAFGFLGGMVAGQLGLGGEGDLNKMEQVLRSNDLTAHIVKKYGLMPFIFPKEDPRDRGVITKAIQRLMKAVLPEGTGKKGRKKKEETLQDACEEMRGRLRVSTDLKSRTLRISFDHENPHIARRIVHYYILELSEKLRTEVLTDASENLRFFDEQVGRTTDTLLREKIFTMMAKEIEKQTFAKAQKYYSFTILDPPIVPDRDKKVKPRRFRYIFIFSFFGFFLSLIGAFFIETIRKLKVSDPARYQEIIHGLKFRKRKAP